VNSELHLKEITIKSTEKSMMNFKDKVEGLEKDKEQQVLHYEQKIKNKKDKIRGL